MKHDTWVKLKKNSAFFGIRGFFPDELFPVRDPFPMYSYEKKALWFIDLNRLTEEQEKAMISLFASTCSTTEEEVLSTAREKGLFIDHKWVCTMYGGAECYWRQVELLDFLEEENDQDTSAFFDVQYSNWIDCDGCPPPLPQKYKDVDFRLKTPEFKSAWFQRISPPFPFRGFKDD